MPKNKDKTVSISCNVLLFSRFEAIMRHLKLLYSIPHITGVFYEKHGIVCICFVDEYENDSFVFHASSLYNTICRYDAWGCSNRRPPQLKGLSFG
jgi:hypothetical protein